MSQIKLPQISVNLESVYDNPTEDEKSQWNQVNPSCLLAYLGIRGYGSLKGVTSKKAQKNATAILAYYDIFKNFYANTQEENFYIIGASNQLTEISRVKGGNTAKIPLTETYIIESGLQYTIKNVANNEELQQITIKFQLAAGGGLNESTLDVIATNATFNGTVCTFTADVSEISDGTYIRVYSIQSNLSTALERYPLENLDIIRDKILQTPGNVVFDISSTTDDMGVAPFNNFGKRTTNATLNTTIPQYGLCLKTYNSDLYQNWINTEWIDGVDGINEASAVDVSDGMLTMDALNLSQKVYNFLNRKVRCCSMEWNISERNYWI